MTKSEFIERLVKKSSRIDSELVGSAVNEILGHLSSALENGKRIEIRRFGSFSLRYRQSRLGRNPKTGQKVELQAKAVPHFKPGKELRERIDVL